MNDARFSVGRRTLLSGAAASLGVALLPRRGFADSPKILVVGSSTMGGSLGRFLMENLETVGYAAHRRAKASSGLARPDFFDWQAEARKLQAAHTPAATIVMFGGNDGQGIYRANRQEPEWIRWHEDKWVETYAARVREFADAVAPGGEHIFWIGLPVMRSGKLNSRVQRLNDIYAGEMDKRENGHFIDVAPVFGERDGKYDERRVVDGKRVKVRAPDGVHLTRTGAKLLAEHVAPTVRWSVAVSL